MQSQEATSALSVVKWTSNELKFLSSVRHNTSRHKAVWNNTERHKWGRPNTERPLDGVRCWASCEAKLILKRCQTLDNPEDKTQNRRNTPGPTDLTLVVQCSGGLGAFSSTCDHHLFLTFCWFALHSLKTFKKQASVLSELQFSLIWSCLWLGG